MIWVVSSAVEHCLHTAGVTGSIPVPPTRFEGPTMRRPFLHLASESKAECLARRGRRIGEKASSVLPQASPPRDWRTFPPAPQTLRRSRELYASPRYRIIAPSSFTEAPVGPCFPFSPRTDKPHQRMHLRPQQAGRPPDLAARKRCKSRPPPTESRSPIRVSERILIDYFY